MEVNMKKELTIEGMSCNHCVMHVTKALNGLDNVSDVKVEIGKATLSAADGFDANAAKDAIKDAGYELIEIK